MPARSAIAVYITSMRLRRHVDVAVSKQLPPGATSTSELPGPHPAAAAHAGLTQQADPSR